MRALLSSSAQNRLKVQVLARFISRPPDLREIFRSAVPSSISIASVFELDMRDLDPNQYGEADSREVSPPIEVESATWAPGGTVDWWVKERGKWLGRVRGPDGRQRWVKASDLRQSEEGG